MKPGESTWPGAAYDVKVAKVTCQFAAAWARRLSGQRGGRPQVILKGGPPGFQCYDLGPPKGPTNVTGTLIVGRCSNAPVGRYFSWAPVGYR